MTSEIPDPRLLSPADRETAAWRAHEMTDMELPELAWFSTRPCSRHAPSSDPLCRDCGLTLRRHQRNGAAWQFLAGRTLLADTVGSGKTATLLATLAMCKETGELGLRNRAVIVCQPAAVRDPWAKDLARLLPAVPAIIADGTPAQRQRAYLTPWEVCVISDRTFAPARGRGDGDVELLREFPVGTLVYDDVDAMRNRSTKTAYAVRRMSSAVPRVHGLHGTPLQKRLAELYCFTEPVGSQALFGSLRRYRERYVSQDAVKIWVRAAICPGGAPCSRHDVLIPDCANCGRVHAWAPPFSNAQGPVAGPCPECRQAGFMDPTGRRRAQRVVYKDNGVQAERLPELQRMIAPLVLRRTSFDDVDLPGVQVSPVRIELLPAQRTRYAELKTGVLRRLKDGQYEVSQAEAAAAFTRGAQICSGLAALDSDSSGRGGNDVSAKLDWAADKITGDLDGEKVICFVYFKPNVAALSARLDREGVGHVLFWSEETSGAVREARRQQFLEDPETRVLIGTTTIERSLNLQVAGHMILVDTILNQSRMTQLIGRARRQGSRHRMVTVHHLLAAGTQEDHYTQLLAREGEMADAVWGESEALFRLMSPREVMEMIAGQQVPA